MEPRDVLFLTDPLQWKALSHPLRLSIVRLLRVKSMTNEELAKEIGVASGKLYFHTKMLLEAGLIKPAGTRQKAAITEKLYRATAMHFQTEPSGKGAHQFASIDSLIDLYKNTAKEYPELISAPENLVDYRLLQLKPDQAAELKSKIQDLIEEAVQSSQPHADAVPMALTVLYHRLPAADTKQTS
jgi:DNA-binding transcriptional ArsR family regulator